jgi:RNA polymerase primary sigma factor
MRELKISKQLTQRSEESISRYFRDITKYTMITAGEEVELSERIRQGDKIALEKLVVSNLRFVISVAKQYQNQGLSFSDLINEGNLGLIKAAQRFDETRGFKFISYAVWWIRQSIIQAISEQTRIVRLPLNRHSTINKINKAIAHLEQEYEREPTVSELAVYLDMSAEEIQMANDIKMKHISLDMQLSNDGNNDFNLYDLIQSGDIPSPDNHLMNESLVKNIDRALLKLSDREGKVLIMSFGLRNTQVCSLHDIASDFNLSAERIRQIKARGLKKLKSIMKEEHSYLS